MLLSGVTSQAVQRVTHGLPAQQLGSQASLGSRSKHGSLFACRAATLERKLSDSSFPQLEEIAVSSLGQHFDWAKQWYPVQYSANIDSQVPYGFELMSQRLVLFRNKEGKVSCLTDSCPHRQVPLSEGRITEQGTLMCSYHGWCFDSSGKCVDVPQSSNAAANRTACNSHRSQVKSYPCKELQGKVWVFAVGGPQGFLESEMTQPALIPEMDEHDPSLAKDGGKLLFTSTQFHRLVPYDYSILLQNVLDPSHVQFSHHSMIGDRDHEHSGHLETSMGPAPPGAPSPEASFSGQVRSYDARIKKLHDWTIQWSAPVLVRWGIPFPWAKDKTKSTLNLHLAPCGTDRSMVMVDLMTSKEEMPWIFRMLTKLASPIWLEHIYGAHRILDSDGVFLAGQGVYQGEKIADGTWGSYRKQYYMPAPADRYVHQMLHWLHGKGGGGPTPRAAGAPPPVSESRKEILLDRYSSHTKRCKSCSGALRNFKALQVAALAGSALSFLSLATALGRALPITSPPVLAAATSLGVLLAVWAKAREMTGLFFFWDYEHSTNNGPANL